MFCFSNILIVTFFQIHILSTLEIISFTLQTKKLLPPYLGSPRIDKIVKRANAKIDIERNTLLSICGRGKIKSLSVEDKDPGLADEYFIIKEMSVKMWKQMKRCGHCIIVLL